VAERVEPAQVEAELIGFGKVEAEMVGSGMIAFAAVEAETLANLASARSALACTGRKEEPALGHRPGCLEPSSPCVPGVLD
jgi:hypothetical protein